MRSEEIAAALRLSKATVSYHLVRLGVEPPRE
jgi:DNA-binding CsgD family transcriptional regulator